ncbi:MAG: hypothetical protein ACFFBP_17100 [Promethearchaeota archaeon]
MDFFLKNLEETLNAINKCINNKVFLVNTKRIRRCNHIKSNNRSKINFIWRTLKFLEEEGTILEKNGITNPMNYKIKKTEEIDIKNFISKIDQL